MGRNAAIAKSREILDRAVSAAGYDSVSLPPGIDPMRLPQDRQRVSLISPRLVTHHGNCPPCNKITTT